MSAPRSSRRHDRPIAKHRPIASAGGHARAVLVLAGVLLGAITANLARAVEEPPPVTLGRDGKLAYVHNAQGDRVPDFSFAGFAGGDVPLPVAPVRVVVSPVSGDNGPRIQAALDYVAGLAPDSSGLRGAVLLMPGRYEITGHLRLTTSGVVLRGAGPKPSGTVLVATGTDRRTLITVAGRSDRMIHGARLAVTDRYVPVGAMTLHVATGSTLRAGDSVLIERPSTKAWIERIGMNHSPGPTPFAWKPGTMNLAWDRVVLSVAGDELTLDAPLTTALDADLGGGAATAYAWPGRIDRVGVENLRCESTFDAANPHDEQHAWMALSFDAAQNCWARGIVGAHFASSLVQVGAGCRAITVEDCTSVAPTSELGGYRRQTFHTDGQLTLFLRCLAEDGRNDFTTGYLTTGPNVFLECEARRTTGFSGSIGSWSSGVLFDNARIDGGALRLDNLEVWNQGVGWSLANSLAWQSSASRIICRSPPGASNWAVGAWAEFTGDGHWSSPNEFVRPDSLYRQQLAERRGPAAVTALDAILPATATVAGAAPSLEQAVPGLALRVAAKPPTAAPALAVQHGWLAAGGRLLTGKQIDTAWWRGSMHPTLAPAIGPAITRFAPGRTGLGFTDDLDALTDEMRAENTVAFRHHWGLWYEQRSTDHERVRRESSDVWPPFFEQPWLRSGSGEAWDRLSRYDLARFNPWYFGRLKAFADLARAKGLVLVDEMYFQHNILEAGAHWAHFPWRSANNINATGFPEPPPYVNTDGSAVRSPDYGKRIFMADAFYDLTDANRRALHRAYIRKCLTNLADEPNVIHTFGDEFSGPLAFMQFWLDVAAEWEHETGRHPLLALSAPKDVQDAILADPVRSPLIAVIDLKYWWQTDKGLFAPPGGKNLTPRQSEREWRGGRPKATDLARMVATYRARFPDKAVMSPLDGSDGWAFVAAGGSLPRLPATTDPRLLTALTQMSPTGSAAESGATVWSLHDADNQWFVYTATGGEIALDLKNAAGSFTVHHVDLASGRITAGEAIQAGAEISLPLPAGKPAAVWISR